MNIKELAQYLGASLSMTLESACDLRKCLPDAHAGDRAGDDEALDFGGAFEDGVDLFQPNGRYEPQGWNPRPTCAFVSQRSSVVIVACHRFTEL